MRMQAGARSGSDTGEVTWGLTVVYCCKDIVFERLGSKYRVFEQRTDVMCLTFDGISSVGLQTLGDMCRGRDDCSHLGTRKWWLGPGWQKQQG